jgi:hypothetical protein
MVTDKQVRRLFMLVNKEATVATAAAKAGITPKTALKYRKAGQLPSQMKRPHVWRTRQDPFAGEWDQIFEMLEVNPGLESKTIFEYFQRQEPGKYQDGQLRTLQRRIRQWRAQEGPAKEVYFPQIHYPGDLGASDFTHMTSLGVTISGELLEHLVYHFVLTYSNWEYVNVCYSESFESLSAGLQNALWNLGGVPRRHRTDRMSAAVNKECNPEKFTVRYNSLLRHYGIEPQRTNAGSGNENGDVEQRHNRFKKSVDQALMLRGSRNFESRLDYEMFLNDITVQLNAGRREKLSEEIKVLRQLPQRRVNDCSCFEKTVGPSSTINIQNNTYSVHSRLIGERVQIKLYIEHLQVWYAQRLVDQMPRLRGRSNHQINYRHIIDWLERKPGAFANYRYQSDMFPSSYFRMAYDELKRLRPLQADKEYVQVLKISAYEGESTTQAAIKRLLSRPEPLSALAVQQEIQTQRIIDPVTDVTVADVDLANYDMLLDTPTEVVVHG